ncbi:MAG TPA: response regulator [Leptolyngbyaceae cyanobacterium]
MGIAKIYSAPIRILKDVQILIVDNDSDSRYLYTLLLEDLGANVKATGSVGQALRFLDRFVPDILISEIKFRGESVAPLMQRLKDLAIANSSTIPIMVTSTCSKNSLDQYLKVGIEAYLIKPIDIDDFVFNIWNLVLLKKISHPYSIQEWRDTPKIIGKNYEELIE